MPLTQVSSRAIEDTLRYVLGASGTNHYTFKGAGLLNEVSDPTLTLSRGHTYVFENRNASGQHPFYIKTSIANGGTQDAYNTGVTNNGGAGGTEIVFTVPHDAPDLLYYQCSSHINMAGQLKIAGAVADGSITTTKIANDAVTEAKIANDAVRMEHILAANVTSSEIADNAVTTAKIADSAVTNAKIASGISSSKLTGALPAIDGSALTGIQGIPSGVIMLWSGASNAIPSGFVLCDGNNSTPDLRDRFVVGAGNAYNVGDNGGSVTATDTVNVSVSISGSGTTGQQNGGNHYSGGASGNARYSASTTHGHPFSFSGSGSGSDTVSIDTRSPYYALCYIMKT